MLEFTPAGKIVFQRLAIPTGTLVPAFIDCNCHDTLRIVYNNGRYVCKKCGKPVDIHIIGNPTHSILSRKYTMKVDELEPIAKQFIENERAKYTAVIDELSEENESLEERCDALDRQLSEETERFNATIDQMKARQEEIVQDMTESYRKLQKDANNLEEDLNQWKDSYNGLVKKFKVLKEENESLENTKNHYKNQAEGLASIPMAQAINYVLDYMTALFNAAKDKENPECLRDMIIGRMEYLEMMLESAGINILRHERDSVLGNERVDIEVKPTNDPEMDCRVIKSEHFGCTFKGDIYPMIPEKVIVFRYVAPEPEVIAPVEEPTVEKEDAQSDTVVEIQEEPKTKEQVAEAIQESSEGEGSSENPESEELKNEQTQTEENKAASEV